VENNMQVTRSAATKPPIKLQPWQFSLRSLFGLTTWIAFGLGARIVASEPREAWRPLLLLVWLEVTAVYLIRLLSRLGRLIIRTGNLWWGLPVLILVGVGRTLLILSAIFGFAFMTVFGAFSLKEGEVVGVAILSAASLFGVFKFRAVL
jgi:hypothetical protein